MEQGIDRSSTPASSRDGKAHNVALIACARKLLIYANTVVERGTPWTENHRAYKVGAVKREPAYGIASNSE